MLIDFVSLNHDITFHLYSYRSVLLGRDITLLIHKWYIQSSKWKFEFILCMYRNKNWKKLLVRTKFHWSWAGGPMLIVRTESLYILILVKQT